MFWNCEFISTSRCSPVRWNTPQLLHVCSRACLKHEGKPDKHGTSKARYKRIHKWCVQQNPHAAYFYLQGHHQATQRRGWDFIFSNLYTHLSSVSPQDESLAFQTGSYSAVLCFWSVLLHSSHVCDWPSDCSFYTVHFGQVSQCFLVVTWLVSHEMDAVSAHVLWTPCYSVTLFKAIYIGWICV